MLITLTYSIILWSCINLWNRVKLFQVGQAASPTFFLWVIIQTSWVYNFPSNNFHHLSVWVTAIKLNEILECIHWQLSLSVVRGCNEDYTHLTQFYHTCSWWPKSVLNSWRGTSYCCAYWGWNNCKTKTTITKKINLHGKA